jgi:uncharacterized protein (TIGR03067 family)
MNDRYVLSLAACVFLGSSSVAQDGPRNTVSELEGTWSPVSLTSNGEIQEGDFGCTYLFKGNTLAIHFGGERPNLFMFRTDTNAKPSRLLIRVKDGKESESGVCIYERKGDTLRMCFGLPGRLPSKFESTGDSEQILLVLTRIKP